MYKKAKKKKKKKNAKYYKYMYKPVMATVDIHKGGWILYLPTQLRGVYGGMRWRKVAGWIPDGVIRIFH
jgi:hypothetical protein